MKRLCVAFIALMALSGAAAAADLSRAPPPAYYPKAPVMVPAYNWTGFYFGINGGGAFGTSAWDSTGSRNVSGGLVGGTVGYNYQFGQARRRRRRRHRLGRHQRHLHDGLPARL